MLFGLNTKQTTPATSHTPSSQDPVIFDVTLPEFETKILKGSLEKPILIDFWAPWCGPCKQLMPILEQCVRAAQGKVLLAKVNIDENPELAQAFRVQSVPTVIAFYQGQPVSGFNGARPASDITKLIDQLIALHNQHQPEALDIPKALSEAAQFLDAKNFEDAQGLYARILDQDPTQIDAYIGLIRVMLAMGDIEQAELYLTEAPEIFVKDARFGAAKTAIDLAKSVLQGNLQGGLDRAIQRVQSSPDDCGARFDLAELYYAAGEKDYAVDALLDLMKKHPGWEEDKARLQLLKYFEAWGFADPASITGRKKLSRMLFS